MSFFAVSLRICANWISISCFLLARLVNRAYLKPETMCIIDYIPVTTNNAYYLTNVYWWERFLKIDKKILLRALGYTCANKTNQRRKLQLDIAIEELLYHTEVVLSVAQYLSKLVIVEVGNEVDSPYNLPLQLDDPTAISITRWLKSSWLERSHTDQTCLQVINKYVAKVNAELGEQAVSNLEVGSLSELRGVKTVIIKEDIEYYVELGDDADVCLQAVILDHCKMTNEVPVVPSITLLHCINMHHLVVSSSVVNVRLEGMNINDLRMMGGVKQLVVINCKVLDYPVPIFGKGQAWEFRHVDIVDVSGLHSLEKLTLRDCKYVKDGSMLGNVQTLTIGGGCMEHYPVPKKGKGQHWMLKWVDIEDVSGLASLESLTLIYCYQLTDISMLGTVRYLTIDGCRNLRLTKQYPKPVGRLQEWTFKSMEIEKVHFSIFASIHQLQLTLCKVVSIEALLSSTSLVSNVIGIELQTAHIDTSINIYATCGKVQFVDKSTLSSAVQLWCENEEIATRIYGDIEKWDVSKVKDMSSVFKSLLNFNSNINDWDVSNVHDMESLFLGASAFNQPLNSWNVTNVTDMSAMFATATSFNQPLDCWDVSNVTDMSAMFEEASSFNQPLNCWDVSKVEDMNCMFTHASSFNQSLDSWNVSNVTDMTDMFEGASSFNQPLDSWGLLDS